MGTKVCNLNDFEFGAVHPWDAQFFEGASDDRKFNIGGFIQEMQALGHLMDLDTLLGPGESIWMAQVDDFTRMMHKKEPDRYPEKLNPDEHWTADIQFHKSEPRGDSRDSVTSYWNMIDLWGGRDCWYIAHYPNETDTIIVDQIGGVFDDDNTNFDRAYDVAGITDASATHSFVRKFAIKTGNEDFDAGRGKDLDESEWIPLPPANEWAGGLEYRKMFWTVGNHGNYTLDETTLQSDVLDIDYANGIITVPWGIHQKDSVMMQIDYTPGLAWHYQLNTDVVGGDNWEQGYQDSAFISARTGDTLTIFACGDVVTIKNFRIELLPPTEDANWIIPKARKDYETGIWGDWHGPVYDVTSGLAMDTILDVPFAERSDSIMKFFEKAPNASWEFVWVDGVERPDVKEGDILRVTAENGDVKDYYIDVDIFRPSHNAQLSAITWPDAPSILRTTGLYGWQGDTIPGFGPLAYSYKITIPFDVTGIPHLVAKAQQLNADVEVDRAVNLYGTISDQTTTFTVSAEDDTTVNVYSVQILKDPLDKHVQPWEAEPIISEYVWRDQWSNYYCEIFNPGTKAIDLSDYMIMMQWTDDPFTMLTWDSAEDEWEAGRYVHYVPGYKWVDSLTWVSGKMRFLENDFENVDPMLQPGQAFVIGHTNTRAQLSAYERPWTVDMPGVLDIDLKENPWGEKIGGNSAIGNWEGANMYLMKIVGDSIQDGLKAATDPDDFEVVEAWGMPGGGNWIIDGEIANAGNQCVTFIRKPEIYEPNPVNGGSFGLTPEESEWMRFDERYGIAGNFGWSEQIMYVTEDLNAHFLNDVTHYRSTISSLFYKVSFGYGDEGPEEVRGLVDGVTVTEFLANIIKADEGQALVVYHEGAEITADNEIFNGDSVVVTSANGDNQTTYMLEVTADGLSDDAVLTSSAYTIDVTGETGTVSDFEYGTLLRDVVDGVTLPAGANMDVIDEEGRYVSLQMLNFDTTYVDVMASSDIYFFVVAEDGQTTITYQLMPNTQPTDAMVFSSVYGVDQEIQVISLVPGGTTVPVFYSNLVASTGATMQVQNKVGQDRDLGYLYLDDELVVTASDGATTRTYKLAMLERTIDYLAYVTSGVYLVDQDLLTIDGETDINEATLVSDVLANLVPAEGATMVIVDADMTEKAGTDDMDDGDMLVVTAGNGVITTTYTIAVDPSSANDLRMEGISVYPNPSHGIVNISGLESGTRVQVYNAVGARVIEKVTYNNLETLSLEGRDKGIYIMILSDDEGVIGNYKLVIE